MSSVIGVCLAMSPNDIFPFLGTIDAILNVVIASIHTGLLCFETNFSQLQFLLRKASGPLTPQCL